jgi:TldD protein
MSFQQLLASYDYADVRVEKGNELIARINDDEIKVSTGEYTFTSARVLVNGSWGFASSNNEAVDIAALIKKAEVLGRLGNARVGVKKCKPEKAAIKKQCDLAKNEEVVKKLCDGAKEMNGRYIKSRTISFRSLFVQKEFYNSEGSEIIESSNRAYLSCSAVAQSGSSMQIGRETAASIEGFEKIDVSKTAIAAREKAQRCLFAEKSPKGYFTVILDNEMTGVFCHEALGHACEADSIIERESILRGKIGKKIASELVNIIDDPTAKEFGFYMYDDEGIKAQKVELVKNGVLVNYLNSRETAFKLKMDLNGHCRAQDATCVPIVRMSNTMMLPGKSSLGELFDIKYGIYVKGMAGGSVDIFSGGFMFKAEEAYEIKNGEKERLLRDVNISGNLLDALKAVELVGNDFGTSPGICGKFAQDVPVSDGGPHIRLSRIKIG